MSPNTTDILVDQVRISTEKGKAVKAFRAFRVPKRGPHVYIGEFTAPADTATKFLHTFVKQS